MTAIGVTGYLFHLEEYVLSFISMIVFGKLLFSILSWNILIEKSQTEDYQNMERIKP